MLYALPFGLSYATPRSNLYFTMFKEMSALDRSGYKMKYMNLGDVEITSENYKEVSSHFKW